MRENNTTPQNDRVKRDLSLGEIALVLDGAAAGAILIELFCLRFIDVLGIILLIPLGLAAFALPIAGIILGIVQLCNKAKRTVKNTVCAIVAIALPVVFVGTMLILMSARVVVISLM